MRPPRVERPHPLADSIRWLFAPIVTWWTFAAVAPWLIYGSFGLLVLLVLLKVIGAARGTS